MLLFGLVLSALRTIAEGGEGLDELGVDLAAEVALLLDLWETQLHLLPDLVFRPYLHQQRQIRLHRLAQRLLYHVISVEVEQHVNVAIGLEELADNGHLLRVRVEVQTLRVRGYKSACLLDHV